MSLLVPGKPEFVIAAFAAQAVRVSWPSGSGGVTPWDATALNTPVRILNLPTYDPHQPRAPLNHCPLDPSPPNPSSPNP